MVINTKTAAVSRRGNDGEIWDGARLTDNYFLEPALSQKDVLGNAPGYLRALEDTDNFVEAKSVFESYSGQYTGHPYFVLDSYQHFSEKRDQVAYADTLLEENMPLFSDNPVLLKALSYVLESQGRYERAHEIIKQVFILRPHYSQSFMDLANSNRNKGNMKTAANIYGRYFYLIKEGFLPADTSAFSKIIGREFNNLFSVARMDKFALDKQVEIEKEDFEGTRLVFEWNDSEAEFDLQFVNPGDQYYVWHHSMQEAPEIIEQEKELGYSCSEFLIDDSLNGTWRINIKYLGNKSLTPSYLKATIYRNYGSSVQSKEMKVFKLDLKNVNQELFSLTVGNNMFSK